MQRQDTSELRLWRAVGCNACNKSGYKSRVAIHEPLVTDVGLESAIQRQAPVDDIRRRAVEGA
ncbi:MAG TPA: hypothetical protein VFS67_22190 [Polyangiaceae bacterium]|nr:hypothetical protein [Polyangiaceae bacterium]